MKLRKIFIILITTIMICLFVLGQSLSTAASGTLSVGISKLNSDGSGYGIHDCNDQSATSNAEYLFDLIAYNSDSASAEVDATKTLYCIKGGFGASWDTNDNSNWDSKRVTFRSFYNMETEKEVLVGNSNGTGLLNGTVGAPDYNINSIKNNYNQILWILDNIYIPGEDNEEDKIALLKAAGIKKKNNPNYEYECYIYEKNQYDYSGIASLGVSGGYILSDSNGAVKDENENYIDIILTDADIEAIQQAAIWYYTNNESENYKNKDNTGWIYYTKNGESYIELTSYSERGNEGKIRNEQANILYRYLIDSAEANKNLYNDKGSLTEPVKVNTDGLDIINAENNNYKTTIKTINIANSKKFVLGPINISKLNEVSYNIGLELTDQSNNIISNENYYFSNAQGESLGNNKTIKDMVGQGEFYITVNSTNGDNNIEKVNAKITTSYNTTNKKVWLEDTKTEQPIVEVTRKENKKEVTLTGQVKEFDLALRKTIVGLSDSVNAKDIVNRNKEAAIRTVNIDKTSLNNGTTATYKHRKDPVVVKTGDIVMYEITIYNEGEQAGFANKIIDQLPSSLTLMSTSGTVISKNGTTNRNTYKVSYDTNTLSKTYNQVTLEIDDVSTGTSLAAYDGQNLDYETVTLMCRVTANASDEVDKVLTNIAYIAEAYNSEDGQIIKTQYVGLDRDSAPGNNPVNKNSLNADKLVTSDIGYTGKDSLTEEELKNKDNYYEGQEDDDDFEKIVLLSIEKVTISGEKIWQDNNNKDNVRPDKVKVGLYRVNADKTETLLETVEITSKNNWKYTFTKVDKYDTNGNEIKYTVKELDGNDRPRENGTIFSSGKGGKYEVSYDGTYNITNIYKPFDLALFKYIAAISEDAKIDSGEYVTDNTNVDGTYLRAPVVTKINSNRTIEYDEHDKTPLIVENGNYVLYRIRVYNEGQIDGYASLIKDSLPEGLEFVIGTESELTESEKEYVTNVNGIWEYESDKDLSVIVTDNLAKGKGAEFETQEGDSNYRANLLTALNVNNQISNDNPDWLEVEVLCKVTAPNSSKSVLVNRAEIAEDSDENGDPITDTDSTPNKWEDSPRDDDQDIEKIKLQCFDLALRKYIFSVNGEELKGEDSRVPVVDVSKLYKKDEDGNVLATTAIYKHPKTPVTVSLGDTVVYSLRVYNEGDVDGFSSEITDHLPEYLEFIEDSKINKKYGWKLSEDGRTVTTTYLSADEYELKGFTENSTTLDYEEIQIECKIKETAKTHENITNIAEISEYKYDDNVVNKDADSESDSLTDENDKDFLPEDKDLPTYKDNEKGEYVPGQEDDDDFEKLYVKEFDLALRKFITAVEEENVTSRIPQVSYEDGKIKYTHPKEALEVVVGNVVEYTIRVYNEGEVAGFASEVTDDIPDYLEYLPEHNTNKEYDWKMYDEDGNVTENVEEAVAIKTTYLSKEAGEERLDKNSKEVNPNLLNEFDATEEISETNPSYKDVKVAFKVKDPGSSEYIITNYAQISDDEDENGNDVIDNDSIPNEWKDGEDDQDIENIKVQYFDLSLLKYVSKVIVNENGKETITETGYTGYENPEPVVKVELDRKKLSKITVKYVYSIKITNEGDIAGYATEITDYVPEGLKFYAEDNQNWTDEGNNVISTKALKDTLLQPGESATVQVTLRWINDKNNMGLKTNTAEISEDLNDKGVPDKDSTPDNKKDGEDDIDIAEVILGVKTGKGATYIIIVLSVLTILGGGITLIKKFVL